MILVILILFCLHFLPLPIRLDPSLITLQLVLPILLFSNLGRGLPFPLSIGFGQCVLFCYVLIRSGVNNLFGLSLPITWIELALVCLIPRIQLKTTWWPFLLALFVFCQRELPRELMLSSDPDQHAFFTKQILDFGFLSMERGAWGEQGFNYPGGFAVLNFIWASLSFTDPRDIVTIQPYIQFLLAVFLFSRDKVAGTLLFLTFTFVPYGFLESNYHQEGTGRLSSIFLLALCLISPKSRKEWFLMGISPLLLFMINPPFGVLSGLLVGLKLLRKPKLIPILALLAFILVICDPYFQSRASGDLNEATLMNTGSEKPQLANYKQLVLGTRSINLSKDLLTKNGYFQAPFWALILLVITNLIIKKREGLNIVWQGCVIIASFLLIQPLFSILGSDPRYFLLEPYLVDSGKMLFLLLTIKGVGFILSSVRFSFVHVLIASALMFIPDSTKPRFSYCGAAGCVSEDDKKVLDYIHNYFNEKETISRILVPNAPVIVFNREKWLFPWGAARALPFETEIPLAFFYFQGDKDYSFDNYKSFVCDKLDIEWLLKENIRYIFLPSDRGGTCVRGGGTVLFKSGEAKFIRLY